MPRRRRNSNRSCFQACAAATRTLLATLAAVAAASGVLLVFRLWTFGYPLPNTYYAKVSPSLLMNIADGVSYLLHFVSSGIVPGLGVWLAIFGAAVMAFCLFASPAEGDGRRPRFSRREGVLSLFGLVALLPSTLTGGDYFPLHRFCQPAYPLLCLLIVFYAQRVPWPAVSRVKIWIMTSIFLIWQTFAGFSPSLFSLAFQGSPIVLEFQIAADSVTRSAILDAFFDEAAEKPVIGVYMAGGISRHYSGMIVDLLGLNNAYIAHQPGDRTGLKGHAAFSKAAFFELKPDLVPIRPDNEFAKSLLKGLFDDESFLARYSFGSLSNLCKGNEVSGFYRLTYLDRVTKNPCFRYNMLFVYDKPHRRWIDLTVSRVESGK